MASHKPGEAGAESLGFDKSDMAIPAWRALCHVPEAPEHVPHDHAGPGTAARIREKLASALAQPEKRQDKDDDHD
jgi:hypothetical protein